MIGLVLAAALSAAPQNLVLEGASVHTGTAAAWRGPIVVEEGRIRPPGTTPPESVERIVLDEGAFLLAGLHDAHAHLGGLGAALENVDLVGTRSYDEVIARVVERALRTPEGEWIQGRGWDQNDWDRQVMPLHDALSRAVPDHPVVLTRVDGHALLANARAMELARIDADTPVPEGGEMLRGEGQRPSGVFVDAAMGLVRRAAPGGGREEVRRHLLLAQERCLAAGLTCVHDAGMSTTVVEVLRELHTEGKWHLRVYVMLSASETDAIRRGPWMTPDRVITVRAVKGYADGALGSRGAALLEPYSDRDNFKGLMLTPAKGIQKLAQLCADHGFQLCVHAIGDRANREVLDAYAATEFGGGRQSARFRIEHAQIVAPSDFERFAELHVIPSMQPTHLTSDMPWAPQRIGPERVPGAYAWRHFHRIGLPVPFGSDFPVESHDPRKGLFAAITTRSLDGGPDEGLRPDQKLGRAAAIKGFTLDAAFGSFFEDDLGTVQPGKLADFTVFDRDLLTVPEDEILRAEVLLTVVGGKVAYRSPRIGGGAVESTTGEGGSGNDDRKGAPQKGEKRK